MLKASKPVFVVPYSISNGYYHETMMSIKDIKTLSHICSVSQIPGVYVSDGKRSNIGILSDVSKDFIKSISILDITVFDHYSDEGKYKNFFISAAYIEKLKESNVDIDNIIAVINRDIGEDDVTSSVILNKLQPARLSSIESSQSSRNIGKVKKESSFPLSLWFWIFIAILITVIICVMMC
jgi:hypothetical protein